MKPNVKITKPASLLACIALIAGQVVYTPGALLAADDAPSPPCVTNTPPRFTCGPNQTTAEDSGPQTVPNWATDIRPHSLDPVPTVFATICWTI